MRLIMMGTGGFAQPTFEKILDGTHEVVGLVTQPDRASGKKRGSTRQAEPVMKRIALERDIPVYQPDSINTPDGVTTLSQWKADLMVVAAYGQILSRDVLATTTHGGVNIHASLLPKYRGAAPIAWAIYNGETDTGVTVIQMSIYLDAGAMLARESIGILPDDTAGQLEERLAPLGARLAGEVIDQIASGRTNPIKQDKGQVSKAPKLKKSDGAIDWTQSAQQIRNQIRAMQPWPTPYTFLNRPGYAQQRVIVLQAGVVHKDTAPAFSLKPGELRVDASHNRLLTGCGHNEMLEIRQLQPAGKRAMSAAEFLRGHDIDSNTYFAPEST